MIEAVLHIPAEALLYNLNVVNPCEQILGMSRIFDSGMRSESWIYGYEISVRDPSGKDSVRYLKEKNIICMGGNLEEKAAQHMRRALHLQELGIPQPITYGVRRATLYQEFVPTDSTPETFEKLSKNHAVTEESIRLMQQLIIIGTTLDEAGYKPLNFLADLLFDPKTGRFIYIDTGSDLGDPNPQLPVCYNSQVVLLRRFPQHHGYILSRYAECMSEKPSLECVYIVY
ncbi:hypothetical protein KKE78_03205 [Patescibacteria group bacterium]|nr:hypothetical protein [Patescibacteria group bacterium]